MKRRAVLPFAIFVICALVYVGTLGTRAAGPNENNHYVHLAESLLHGQLAVLGDRPPGTNDWAYYGGKWYVTFPPLPALVIMPVVAIWGLATRDSLFWALLAGVAPALLFALLERLSERGESSRSVRDNLLLSALFAFGSVYFFTAVQGSVWFAAHIVASVLIVLYMFCALDARRPALAGLCLGCLGATRTAPALAIGFFTVEALRAHRRVSTSASNPPGPNDVHPLTMAWRWARGADLPAVFKAHVLLALPIAVVLGLYLWFNWARFDDPFTFGHEYLEIRWRQRIDEWGLFNYHYLSKNLAVFLASLPWILDHRPYLRISLHGLALWVTTPNLLWTLWPKHVDVRSVGLWVAILPVAAQDLCYQNSGWIQFGYRFALDYFPYLIVLLALGGRRFGPGFYACMAFAIAINTFGAITFERYPKYYDNDGTQNRVFQPD